MKLHQQIIDKLKEMGKDGHVEKAEEPTEWVSSMI